MPSVYVATNEFIPGLVKIGMTSGEVKSRMDSLSGCTSSPGRFICYYHVETDMYNELERNSHRELSKFRLHSNKEFFRINPLEASASIYGISRRMKIKCKPPVGIHELTYNHKQPDTFDPGEYMSTGYFESFSGIPHGSVKICEDNGITEILPNYILIPGKIGRRFLKSDVLLWKMEKKDDFFNIMMDLFRNGAIPFRFVEGRLPAKEIVQYKATLQERRAKNLGSGLRQ